MAPERRAESRAQIREMMPGFLIGLPVWMLLGAWLLQSPWGVLGLIALLALGPLCAGLMVLSSWRGEEMPSLTPWTAALTAPYLAIPILLFGPLILLVKLLGFALRPFTA